MSYNANVFSNKLKACLLWGAIGDIVGGRYEGSDGYKNEVSLEFDGDISDDTQLTLATCEAICETKNVDPASVAKAFVDWYNKGRLTGLGASTLKALRELQLGGHWALCGRTGEYAAGNGAAMRIAPLAFKREMNKETIRDVTRITHRNEEAYSGALAIYLAVKYAQESTWKPGKDLIGSIVDELPDSNVRDRMIEINTFSHLSIRLVGSKFKTTGYVADSVPMAVFAAQKAHSINVLSIFQQLLEVGGDTDTICSMVGQIVGATKAEGILLPQEFINSKPNLIQSIDEIAKRWNY